MFSLLHFSLGLLKQSFGLQGLADMAQLFKQSITSLIINLRSGSTENAQMLVDVMSLHKISFDIGSEVREELKGLMYYCA